MTIDDCCPEGPGWGGEVHVVWQGAQTDIGGNLINNLVFFDDNLIVSSPLSEGENSKFDHYAIEWIEEHEDGTVGAIISERKVLCMWPQATITSRIFTVGEVFGATATSSCKNIITPKCTGCELNEPWCRYAIKIKYGDLYYQRTTKKITKYGGLHWESMKFIASNQSSINQNGWSGPIGDNTSPGNMYGFRIAGSSEPTEQQIMDASNGSMYEIYDGDFVDALQKLTNINSSLKNWTEQNLINLDSINESRKSQFATERAIQAGESRCCSVKDWEYLGGTCCGDDKLYMDENGILQCCDDLGDIKFEVRTDPQTGFTGCFTKEYYCQP